MDIQALTSREQIADAAFLAWEANRSMKNFLPDLPDHGLDEYTGRIGWIREHGSIFGIYDGSRLKAFLGYFILDDFRNAGPGALTPDWCMGIAKGLDPAPLMRTLLREALSDLVEKNIRIHAAGVHADRNNLREILELSGYGRIVLDAARQRTDLERDLGAAAGGSSPITIRKACPADSTELARLDAALAVHNGASPVLMPRTHGLTPSEWSEWFGEDNAIAFMAESGGRPIGFIRAQDPQEDVSFTVHGPSTLAINGMFVEPDLRGRGVARGLLGHIVEAAGTMNKTVVSVDCETLNPEAYGFWTQYFIPVAWSLERRF